MRSDRARLRPWHWVLGALFLTPPGVRVGLHFLDDGPPVPIAPGDALRVEVETLRGELRRAQVDLDVRGLALAEPLRSRYAAVLGDILPVNDPAWSRSALWVLTRGPRRVPRDSAALWEAPPGDAEGSPGQALVGRVARVFPLERLVTVQTILDPGLRVRFRLKGASGILWGTGKLLQDRPVLEIRHLSGAVELSAGDAVFTAGEDGVYPPGVLIGFLDHDRRAGAPPGAAADPPQLVVRGAVPVTALTRLVLSIDLALERVTDIQARETRRGGSP